MSDASGLRVNMGLRSLIKQTRSRHAALDLVILHPKYRFDGNRKSILYCGLIIELKKESPFKKDGSLKSDEHLQEQQKTIDELNRIGYYAGFVWDLSTGIELINTYLKK